MEELTLLQRAVPPLMGWYRIHKRELPWRGTRDPYQIWVSEIMLQQTRVEAVKGYYLRFLERFPTPAALASAEMGEVLKSWEGLGYYSRARNLHAAAKQIAKEGFPATFEGVRALPGVGDYTAGAICSIAYNLPCPAVDGNVLRILTRLFASEKRIDDLKNRAEFSALLQKAYPKEAGDFCQALMELGALVCLPNGAPLCGECPWNSLCRAHLSGEEERYPVRAEKRPRRVENWQVLVLTYGGKFALEKREKNGLLAGLWQFPLRAEEEPSRYGRVIEAKRAKHIFTHVEWEMQGYLIEAEEELPSFLWVTPKELRASYVLPSAFKGFFPWVFGAE